MAVELNLGGKNYQYTPRHPYREVVISNGECTFKVEAPDGTVLCIIRGETGNFAEKKIKRTEDLTQEEIRRLLQYGFFSPNGVQPPILESEILSQVNMPDNILKRIRRAFSKQTNDRYSNA
ncbi:MAG: hypothetical protein V4642_16035 [Bacteroidota bacterium]